MYEETIHCPVSKKCGGCQLSNMTYAEQLSFKQAKVIRLLGKMHRVGEIMPSPRVFHYRNKVQAAFGKTKSGMIISGVYQSSTHQIVKTDACLIEDETADAIKRVGMVVEGINAIPAAIAFADKYEVDMPIVRAVDAIVNHNANPKTVVAGLMERNKTTEVH